LWYTFFPCIFRQIETSCFLVFFGRFKHLVSFLFPDRLKHIVSLRFDRLRHLVSLGLVQQSG
jgi:hypothetical protein